MARVDDFLQLIDDPDHPPLETGDPADRSLLALLVHLAYSDGIVQGDEFALLSRVRPDLDAGELMAWAIQTSGQPLSLPALAAAVPTPPERLTCLRFAARMVCLDGDVAAEERAQLGEIARALDLPADSVGRAVDEIVARGGVVSRERIANSLRNMLWRDLRPDRDELGSDLAALVPATAEHVASMHFGDEEVAGLCFEGLVARFDDASAWLAWAEIRSYTRVPVPGAGFHLRTVDGRHLSCSDGHMRDIGALLDFIYGR